MWSSCPFRRGYSIALVKDDFARGKLAVDSFIRPNRLFTVEQSVVVYTAGQVLDAKLAETLAKIRGIFS
jgi:mRNA interferase MazF